MTAEHPLSFDVFVELAAADPAVVGLVLKGSQAHEGMATEHSDHDLVVVLADGAPSSLSRFAGHRTPELDLVLTSFAEFRAVERAGFERYGLARGRVLLDRVDGGVIRAVSALLALGGLGDRVVGGEPLAGGGHVAGAFRCVGTARAGAGAG